MEQAPLENWLFTYQINNWLFAYQINNSLGSTVQSFFYLFRIVYFIPTHKRLKNVDVKVNIRVKTSQDHKKLLSSGRCCTFRQQVGCRESMWDWHSMRFILRFAAKLILLSLSLCEMKWKSDIQFVSLASRCSVCSFLLLCPVTFELPYHSILRNFVRVLSPGKNRRETPLFNRRFFAYGFLKSSGWAYALQIFTTSFTSNYLGLLRNFIIILVNKD